MKKIVLVCFFIPCLSVISQTQLFPFEGNGRTGYMDSLRNILIPAQFDHGDSFSEGLAAIWENGKKGYIDLAGKIVIEPAFGMAKPFNNGVAVVMTDSTFGLIDQKGKFILKPVYESIQFGNEGKIGVKRNDLWGFCTITGKKITPVKYRWIGPFSEGLAMVESDYDGKYGFINERGKVVIPLKLQLVYSGFSDGYATVDDSTGRCFIDKKGNNIFGSYYYNASAFSNGRAYVQDSFDSNGYFIDTHGKRISEQEFTGSWGFGEGFCGASTDSGFVVIDTTGTIVFRSLTIELRFYHGDFGFFCDHSGSALTWGIMNKKQEIVSDRRFTSISSVPGNSFVETFIGVTGEWCDFGKKGYMNIYGEHFWEVDGRLFIPIH